MRTEPHRSRLVTQTFIECPHLHSFELGDHRTHWGREEGSKVRLGWGSPGFVRKVVPAGAASRVSLGREQSSAGVGVEARHHDDGDGVQSLGNMLILGKHLLAPGSSQARWHQGDRDQVLGCPSRDKDRQNK